MGTYAGHREAGQVMPRYKTPIRLKFGTVDGQPVVDAAFNCDGKKIELPAGWAGNPKCEGKIRRWAMRLNGIELKSEGYIKDHERVRPLKSMGKEAEPEELH